MDQVNDYSDDRLTSSCLYCGGDKTTREHAPSAVLLDAPLPANLPIVGACQPCNESFSRDEEYVACLVECAISGSTDPDQVSRKNIARKLRDQPALRARLEQCRVVEDGRTTFAPEVGRVENVVRKLAQCHVLYELSEVMRDPPSHIGFNPRPFLTVAQKAAFEKIEQPSIWPEVGCRMMTRLGKGDPGWQIVQPERYRYATIYGGPTVARMVLSEYLACEVVWDD